jgi:hypothetical protein
MEASMKSLLPSLLVAAVCGCQAPTPTFEGDTVTPPSSDVGKLELAVTSGDGPNGAHIIFLNYAGQTIQPAQGYDDPDTGASWIAKSTVAVPAFDASPYAGQFTAAQAQQAITNYFKTFYAPFNVQVVTTRPTGVRYTMCIIGGDASQVLGSGSSGVAGIAPLDCGNRNESEITYAFSAGTTPRSTGLSLTQALKAIAVTAAQETAHAYGLNHTDNNTDIMYPQLDPSQNAFFDGSANLIQNSTVCQNATTQNSKQLLTTNIGAGNGMMTTGPAPTVSFVAPKNGDTVPLDFTFIISASESGGSIAHVDVSAGSQMLSSMKTAPYRDSLSAPGDGAYQLTATAFDANGNFQSATVQFTAKTGAPAQQLPPCMSDNDCVSGQVCKSGMCVAGSTTGGTTGTSGGTTGTSGGTTGTSGGTTGTSGGTTGGIQVGIPLGGDCTENPQCMSGICDTRDGHKYCTATCDPASANACPTNLSCVASNGTMLCQKKNADNGGGCSAAPGSPVETGFGFFLLLALVAVTRRRAW